jgi:hypothetical protein
MPYRSRLNTLKESHRLIDEVIIEKMKDPNFDELKVNEMKKQKLMYKDEIRKLERAQWEHDNETVDFEDNR